MKKIICLKNFEFLILLIASITPIFFLFLSWNFPIIEHMGFRQTQTALSAFWISSSPGWLEFITPVFGFPWSVPMEYPIYQIIVSTLSNISPLTLENSGRVVTIITFYLALWPIRYLLAEQNDKNLIFYIFYLSSPILLFFSNTFLIESFSFLLSISVLSTFIYFIKDSSIKSAIIFISICALCGLQKVTGLMASLVGCGVYSLFFLASIEKNKLTQQIIKIITLLFFAVIIPIAWVFYSDMYKSNGYITNFLTSTSLNKWNYGTFSQRLDIHNLAKLFGFRMFALGGMIILFFRIALYKLRSFKESGVAISCIVAGLFGPLIFFNLYLVHDYYMVASIGFIGLGLYLSVDDKRLRFKNLKQVSIKLASATLLTNIIIFSYWYMPKINKIPSSHLDMFLTAQAIKNEIEPDKVILTAGVDWDSTIPFYSEKYALMLPSWERNDYAPFVDNKYFDPIFVLENINDFLGNKKLGAIVICKVRIAEDYNNAVNFILNKWQLDWKKEGSCSYGFIESEQN